MNLIDFLKKNKTEENISKALVAIAEAIKEISLLLDQAPLIKSQDEIKKLNIHREIQTKADILSNEIFLKKLSSASAVIGAVSEEENKEIIFKKKRTKNQVIVFFDPLDGSSNLKSNISIGSIFSLFKLNHSNNVKQRDFLQKGSNQKASGYSVYGPSTLLIITIGNGVFKFCLDKKQGIFECIEQNILIPKSTNEFSINMSNEKFWKKPIRRYIKDCLAGVEGPRKKDFNMRWVGSMVADINRILTQGGIYLYPTDNKLPKKDGRLRSMYEINPMALIIENAGGLSFNELQGILDTPVVNIHQRNSAIMGSKDEVLTLKKYFNY